MQANKKGGTDREDEVGFAKVRLIEAEWRNRGELRTLVRFLKT